MSIPSPSTRFFLCIQLPFIFGFITGNLKFKNSFFLYASHQDFFLYRTIRNKRTAIVLSIVVKNTSVHGRLYIRILLLFLHTTGIKRYLLLQRKYQEYFLHLSWLERYRLIWLSLGKNLILKKFFFFNSFVRVSAWLLFPVCDNVIVDVDTV